MLIIRYTLDGVEQLDPSFFSGGCREDAEARAREIGGWVEESDLTPSELTPSAGWPQRAPALEDRLLTSEGEDFTSALAAATAAQLGVARSEVDGCGPEQSWRQHALVAAHEAALLRIPPAGPCLPSWGAEDFTASEDLPRLRRQIARARVLSSFLAAALRSNARAAIVPLHAFDHARARFAADVSLGMWRWDPAWGFDRVPEPWPLAYLLEAVAEG